MFIKDLTFEVSFSDYAEKHYGKDFIKKYTAKQWIETKKTISTVLSRAYAFQQTSLIDNLKFSQEDSLGIFKLDFRVAGTNTSPKSSGKRVIFSLCNQNGIVKVLLVYSKNHCTKKRSETQWIIEQLKNGFPKYKKYLK